ncbi:MAG: glycoside hydrolase family 36 protein, partial [Chloroflexota bacterium]
MMEIKKIISAALSFFLFIGVFSQENQQTIINQKTDAMSRKISWEGIELTSDFLKPETSPATSGTETWKLIAETTAENRIGGVPGTLMTKSFSASTGQVDCQTWVSDNNNLIAFRQIYTNTTKKIIKLNNLYPLSVEGNSVIFGNSGEWRIFEQFRHKNDLPQTEIPKPGLSISCDPFFIINSNKGEGKNLLIGFQTFSLHLADVQMSFGNDARLEKILANCEFEGVEVPPDASRTSQWVIISNGNNANTLIEDYTARIRAQYNMKMPASNAPAVYCTWYYHADNYNEEIFNGDITQFRKEHLPFDVFLIDECWDVNDWGDFESNKSFPLGMKRVADEIKSVGYTAGIWTAPFLVDGESDLSKNHPSWLLRNSKGQLCTFNMNSRDHFIFDLTYPGVCEYLEGQFRKIASDWGYSYFKFDFMRSVFIDSDQQFFDKTATSLEAYRRGLEAIRKGVGSDAYISVCGGHYGASYGIANTQRSGSDVKSQWNEKELPKYRQNVLRTWMSGLWHVDPDAMMVRRQEDVLPTDKRNLTNGLFSDDEAFTNTLNQFIGGELVTFTEDFAKIDEDRKMLYRHVVPSVNSASRP